MRRHENAINRVERLLETVGELTGVACVLVRAHNTADFVVDDIVTARIEMCVRAALTRYQSHPVRPDQIWGLCWSLLTG